MDQLVFIYFIIYSDKRSLITVKYINQKVINQKISYWVIFYKARVY